MSPALPVAAELRDIAAWWGHVVAVTARDFWDGLPGPWPVKVALLALLAAGQLIPGEVDEVVMLMAIGWVKRRMDARKAGEIPPSP